MQTTGERWRLGHRPALDGLRGVAVLLVVASHLVPADSPLRRFGETGVVVFFTLSGFLITSLLLEEHDRTRRVDFAAFYLRRARRLLPAAFAVIAVVAVLGLFLGADYSGGWPAVVGALTYTGNWLMAAGRGAHALSHTWSLSIEEQFYLLWPVALTGLLRSPRRILVVVLAAALAVTAVWPLLVWDGGNWLRLYYGSDMRAFPLFAGCLLAVHMRGRREGRSRPWLAVGALVGMLLATLQGAVVAQLLTPTLIAVLTVAAICATSQGAGVRWLAPGWLVLVGRRSYGLYLWHLPAIVLLERCGISGWSLAAVALPVSALLTAASWRFVESPFLSARVRQKARPQVPSPTAAGVLTAAS